VFVERLWRSVKYEHVYLYEYALVPELEKGLHHRLQVKLLANCQACASAML
jgi:hypothetical protein